MNNTESFHNKIMAVAETVRFRFEADLFKSVPMILGFGCHGQQVWNSAYQLVCAHGPRAISPHFLSRNGASVAAVAQETQAGQARCQGRCQSRYCLAESAPELTRTSRQRGSAVHHGCACISATVPRVEVLQVCLDMAPVRLPHQGPVRELPLLPKP